MKHVQLGRAFTIAFLALSAASVGTGCTAKAQVRTAPPPPPPPPPPAATTPPPPAEPPKPQGQIIGDVKDGRVNIPGAIVFDTGKASIKEAESMATLNQLKEFLDKNPQVTLLRVEGHTDDVGDDTMNETLSGQRALAVVMWLTGKGVNRNRLIAVGFGETKPVGDNKTKEGREQNRRTEFHIAQVDGRNRLGKAPDAGGKVFN